MSDVHESQTPTGPALLSIAAPSVLVGISLFLFGAPLSVGVDTGLLGAVLVVLGVVLLSMGLKRVSHTGTGATSFGERTAWISLAATALAGVYLFSRLLQLGGDTGSLQNYVSDAAGKVIAVLALGEIIGHQLRRRERGTLIDERDVEVRRRAASSSHAVLLAMLAVMALGLGSPLVRSLPLATPTGVAHGIAIVLILSELVRHAVTIWIYRRDRG